MADRVDKGYDTSIGTNERSAVSATKFWVIVLAIIGIIGIVLIGAFLMRGGETPSGGTTSGNSSTSRPDNPGP
jgi:hypothetical protein